ncbi:hypothetical protein [Paenibacillus sp. PvR133]|jgi:DMSO/TMAO reductase YedYZ heme-binding membrane subunit|uniref:hypothetical protein n=1 Tax=Paenibacillus TaxID=44249 RepID=UPI000FC3BEF0|nr:hypothetical protein [Paenibacillus sp. PvR133]MBP1176749.1 DMSO/TMAO reductase YedYZ heme-binding membrane subunit [Paenibacillus sp. PvR133]
MRNYIKFGIISFLIVSLFALGVHNNMIVVTSEQYWTILEKLVELGMTLMIGEVFRGFFESPRT